MCEQPINVHALKQIHSDIIRYSPYPKLVNIIAVTKNFNITAIQSAVENNIYQIGENRVQEYSKKIDALIISGGNFDIDPSHFGETTNSSYVKTKPERTDFETRATRKKDQSNAYKGGSFGIWIPSTWQCRRRCLCRPPGTGGPI